jgi:hypothetical protein
MPWNPIKYSDLRKSLQKMMKKATLYAIKIYGGVEV